MKVLIEIELDIELIDDDLSAGGPLETRMRDSARDAISNAVHDAMSEGFLHDMGSSTCISIERVALLPPPIKPVSKPKEYPCDECGRQTSEQPMPTRLGLVDGPRWCWRCRDKYSFKPKTT